MKTKLIKVIKKKLNVIIKDIGHITMGEIPIDIDGMENARKYLNVDVQKIEKEHGKIVGWFLQDVFNTNSGEPEPGDMYWDNRTNKDLYWDNQEGPYLIVVLPNGHHWNIDSRASNCTMKDDKTHRCWCRHGEPPNITVDKKGHTCKAGAGSIMMGDYHGFLRNGEFINS